MNRFDSLDRFWVQAWDLLVRAAHGRSDPMRTPMMASYDGRQCQLRTIVLREVNKTERKLLFFTDGRSPKVHQLKKYPSTAITFWDPRRKVQLRLQGQAILKSGGEEARAYWDGLSLRGRSSYAATKPPGTLSESDTDGLPAFWSDEMDKKEADFAFHNFMLIQVEAEEIDALHLHPEGHQRAVFRWTAEGWEKNWKIS